MNDVRHAENGAAHEPASPASCFPASLALLEAVVPHRGAMLLLDAVQCHDDTSIVATARVDRRAWYANANGDMPAWIGLELMAQAIAAHAGLVSMHAGQRARPGVLLGSHQYTAHVPAFRADATLEIAAVELLRSAEGQGAYECSIRQRVQDGAREVQDDARNNAGNAAQSGVQPTLPRAPLCAEAVIKVYQPPDFQAFIKERLQP